MRCTSWKWVTAEDWAKAESQNNTIKFELADSPGNFDWQTMTLVGAHPNCVVLVDHYAIEQTWSRMLEMLHRFDPKE